MASRDEIVSYANDLMGSDDWKDYGPNGLQVVGADDVTTIATAVSCSAEVFERAAGAGAQMLIVHHGLFWRDTPQVVDRLARQRLRLLFDNDLNLVAFHLPLDAHEALGNNVLLRDGLGLAPTATPFAIMDGKPLGQVGRYDEPVTPDEFRERLANLTGREPLHLGATPDRIATVGICSGGAARVLAEAVELGLDAFVTGEPSEPTLHAAQEGDVAFFAAGHYATETFGVRALGEHLAERFELRHTFVDAPNPV